MFTIRSEDPSLSPTTLLAQCGCYAQSPILCLQSFPFCCFGIVSDDDNDDDDGLVVVSIVVINYVVVVFLLLLSMFKANWLFVAAAFDADVLLVKI